MLNKFNFCQTQKARWKSSSKAEDTSN